ncbi:MAG TPA: hypothetical protein VN408_08380, partial [Actinoplanes sp.]|nr:hypothetical protein [Actinoplanes sp.]
PYEAWQVVGCALSLLVLLVGAVWAGAWEVAAAPALTVGFTAAWTVQAAQQPDQTGLFVIGAVAVLIGVGIASAVVSILLHAARGRWTRSPADGSHHQA